ncbi:hypothetical protein JQC92_11250 [Shewanella sp. 202IG2-18]|uniref:hypothetical protein n=1 Tax=Parashewanella hymeniacidonis TaxID=2807618 RepID=UPI00195F6FDD|nr:hypothetical protein [Parashewanella hymeniacidonis]MBM7072596.1 hypothetical protein [Parashewanella hymeniacidonis]
MSREFKFTLQPREGSLDFVSGNLEELKKIDARSEFVFKVDYKGNLESSNSPKTFLVRAISSENKEQTDPQSQDSDLKSRTLEFLEFTENEGFISLEKTNESKQLKSWFLARIGKVSPETPELQKNDNAVKVECELPKDTELKRSSKKIEVEQIRDKTVGFSGGLNMCFANSALKQLLLEPGNQELAMLSIPHSVHPLAKAFQSLSNVFHDIRAGNRHPKSIYHVSKAFFSALIDFRSSNPKGLKGADLLAYQKLKGSIARWFQREQDAMEFSDSLCQLLRLNKHENTIYERNRFELTPPSESMHFTHVQSQKPELGAFKMIYPKGKLLAETFSEEVEADKESFITVVKGQYSKTKDACLYNSFGCAAIDEVKSIRLCASVFQHPNIRKVEGGHALFDEDDDSICLKFRKNLDIEEGQKESYTDPTVEVVSANFKIHTVVFHVGGNTVNSGHYFTLENLGDKSWLIHDGLSISIYEGTMKQFVLNNRQCVPYLLNLVKV